jgi:hypothetical protein
MLAQLAIGIGRAAIVPSEHDTGSASNGGTLISSTGRAFVVEGVS